MTNEEIKLIYIKMFGEVKGKELYLLSEKKTKLIELGLCKNLKEIDEYFQKHGDYEVHYERS